MAEGARDGARGGEASAGGNSGGNAGGASGPRTAKIFVGGLSGDTTEHMFHEFFSQYGKIAESQIMQDHYTGRSRGFGFVTFHDPESVDRVFTNGSLQELNGKVVELKRAIPRNQISSPPSYPNPRQQPHGPGPHQTSYGPGYGPPHGPPPSPFPSYDAYDLYAAYGYAAVRAAGWSGGAGWGWGALPPPPQQLPPGFASPPGYGGDPGHLQYAGGFHGVPPPFAQPFNGPPYPGDRPPPSSSRRE